MANLSPTKVPVPEQDPNVRNHNFEEVNLGYTPEMAVEEAGRCLQCKKPACVAGCPEHPDPRIHRQGGGGGLPGGL